LIDRAMHYVPTLGGKQKSFSKDGPDLQALKETYTKYYAPLRQDAKIQAPARDGLIPLLQSARRDYLTNCKNHIMTNFRPKHRQYLLNLVIRLVPSLTLRRDQWKIANALYRDTIVDEKKSEDHLGTVLEPLTSDERNACRDLVTTIRAALRPVMPITKALLAQKWSCFLPWFHTILSEFARSP